ncbi:MAG: DUF3786 domain-containing protein [Caldimicrobium sp.]
MKSYLDLLKVLPKSNCGECGEQSCLLFALKVFSKALPLHKCPYLSLENLPEGTLPQNLTFNQLLENLKYLKEKFSSLSDLKERAYNLGCMVNEEEEIIILPYLDLQIPISFHGKGKPQILKDRGNTQLDPRDEILIYNYFIFNGKTPLSFDFVGLEFFPHSISKVKTLKKYAEEPLSELLSSESFNFNQLLQTFEIADFSKSASGLSFLVRVLPKIFLRINFWYGEAEENLPSSCKILYDRVAIDYLDLECLVFCAERFVEKLKA